MPEAFRLDLRRLQPGGLPELRMVERLLVSISIPFWRLMLFRPEKGSWSLSEESSKAFVGNVTAYPAAGPASLQRVFPMPLDQMHHHVMVRPPSARAVALGRSDDCPRFIPIAHDPWPPN
jgi:hypothetical protein